MMPAFVPPTKDAPPMSHAPTDPMHRDEAPPVVDGFRILEKLGSGATSSVWKAEQISLNRMVVIKVLSERLSREPDDLLLFQAEARMAATLKHPGIVQVYDFGQSQDGQRSYCVMEYVSGYSAGDWLRRKGRIPEPDVLLLAHAVADAMHYAWTVARIVHCDIKPDNILVDGDGTVKLTDLGLARAVKHIGRHPRLASGEVIITGTPNYMAPEQVRGTAALDCRTDIYALGATLYHLATGCLPFGDSPPDVVLDRQIREPLPCPQTKNPDLSTGLTRLITNMTAKEPSARVQSWSDLTAELKRLEQGMPQPTAGVARPPPEDRTCRFCGKPLQPEGRYCAFCGRLAAIRLRSRGGAEGPAGAPVSPAAPAVNWPQGEDLAPPPSASPDEAPAPRRKAFRLWRSHWGANLRMALSLALLIFIGYAMVQRLRYGRDIIAPLRRTAVISLRRWSAQLTDGLEALGNRVWDRPPHAAIPAQPGASEADTASTQPDGPDSSAPAAAADASAAPEPASAGGAAATGDPAGQPAWGSPAPAADTEAASKPADPWAAAAPAAPAAAPPPAASDSWAVPTPATPAPAASDSWATPAPAPTAATAWSSPPAPATGYERLLAQCRQEQPKVGDTVTIEFKTAREPVNGVLEGVTAEGLQIKVPAGVIAYPFRLMSEKTRLLFFPEERARTLERQTGGVPAYSP